MEYKRKYREMDDDTKQKISQKLKGRSKSSSTKDRISGALKRYWSQIPSKKEDNQ